MKFSIVVNTYNRAATIENTLESFSYLRHPDFEVIVVNGPSTDGTTELLERYKDQFRIGNCSEPNISMSRNVGIQMAKGEIVAFIDDDAVPEVNWLDELEKVYETDRGIGGVGGFVRDNSGVEYQCKYIVCDRSGDSEHFTHEPIALSEQRPQMEKYYTLIGVNSSFRREALLEIGGFDEEYAYFLDETDICVRLVDAGWKIQFAPQAEVYHKFAASHLRNQERIPTSLYLTARSKIYFGYSNSLPNESPAIQSSRAIDGLQMLRDCAHNLYSAEKIDIEHRDHLLKEVNQGFGDAIRDYYSRIGPPMSSCDLRSGSPSDFLRVQPLLESSERLKLILISQDYPPRPCGGVGVFMHNLAEGLAAEGHEISVITRSENDLHSVDFENGVWVHRIPTIHHGTRSFPELPDIPQNFKDYAYSVYDEALRIQQQRGASITLASIWDLESAACVASKSFTNYIYLVTTYKLSIESKPEWQKNRHFMENCVEKMIEGERWIIENCDSPIASTVGIRRDVEQEYGVSLADTPVIPFGLPAPRFASFAKQDNAFRNRATVLFVGRLEKRKGAHHLLNVIPHLLGTNPDLDFQIVGNDSILVDGRTLKDAFHAANPDLKSSARVKFYGQVDNETLEQLYADCDLFVAPSTYESFGLIYLEAMRYGKPCIGTNVGGIPEVLGDGTGIMVPPGDEPALRKAISTLADDQALREKLGHAGLNYFNERYSIEQFVKSIHSQLNPRDRIAA